jgi:hypothetical protein
MIGRRGVALLMAIVVTAALGLISVTGFALARAERAAGLAAVARIQARGAAEAAAAEAMLGWPPERTAVAPGEESPLTRVTGPGPASGQATLRALGGPLFAIRAEGVRKAGSGERLAGVRLELLVLLAPVGADSLVHPRVYPRGWRLLP